MLALPQEAKLLGRFACAFTAPGFDRFLVLCVGAIVTMGRRTVSRILWTMGDLADGDPSRYHRFFSAARWSMWPLARVLAAAVLELVPAEQPVMLDCDDTVARHPGKKVWARGCHRDAVRSSWGHTVFKWGHKWVVLAVNVKLPPCKRSWALPVLAALYTPAAGPKKKAAKKGNGKTSAKARGPRAKTKRGTTARRHTTAPPTPRHKTPPLLARQMVATLIHWFPDRKFVLLGDWGFASHDLAWFCRRHRSHVTLVGRIRSDARLYALPPQTKRPGPGRRPRKGSRLPRPKDTVASAAARARISVAWYGGSCRAVQMLSGCGGWYRGRGNGTAALIPIRWVFVYEEQSDREDYFYSTDPDMTPQRIVELFAGRWNIEVTFQEVRAHLGFETTRQWCKNSVRRGGALLLGLFSVVALVWNEWAKTHRTKVHGTPCYAKTDPTFADALAAVRVLLWEQVILTHLPGGDLVTKLPPALRDRLPRPPLGRRLAERKCRSRGNKSEHFFRCSVFYLS